MSSLSRFYAMCHALAELQPPICIMENAGHPAALRFEASRCVAMAHGVCSKNDPCVEMTCAWWESVNDSRWERG